MKDHKKLVYGGQKGLDSHIARLAKSGWKVAKLWIDHWLNGKKVYIAELEKELHYDLYMSRYTR